MRDSNSPNAGTRTRALPLGESPSYSLLYHKFLRLVIKIMEGRERERRELTEKTGESIVVARRVDVSTIETEEVRVRSIRISSS